MTSSRRFGLTAVLLLLGLLGALQIGASLFPAAAGAIPRECELFCEEPPEEEKIVYETLTIKVEGIGNVSGSAFCSNGELFGSHTCSFKFESGEAVSLSATPGVGMTFLGWTGSCSGTGGCSMSMTSNKSVTAKFADMTPPPAPLINSPTEGQVFEWTSGNVEVKFSDSELVGYYCALDSSSFASAVSCTSPWLIENPSAGSHTVYVWAKDSSGNISTPASRGFKVVIPSPPSEEGGSGGEETPKEEGGGDSGGGGGTPSPIPTIAPPPGQVDAQAVVRSHLLGKATVFRKLTLKGLPAGASVAATCKGKGCPFKRKQVKVADGVADLSALFAKHALGAGALIELKVTAPGMTGETIDVKTRAGKAPKVTTS